MLNINTMTFIAATAIGIAAGLPAVADDSEDNAERERKLLQEFDHNADGILDSRERKHGNQQMRNRQERNKDELSGSDQRENKREK
jgi:hypothetical protein